MMVCYIILEIFVYLGMKESMSSKKHIHLSFHDKLGKIVEQLHIYCYWPRMNETISKYIKGCVLCSTSKLSNKNLGLYMALPIPSQSWEIVTMDFVGGLLLHSKMPPSHWKKSWNATSFLSPWKFRSTLLSSLWLALSTWVDPYLPTLTMLCINVLPTLI